MSSRDLPWRLPGPHGNVLITPSAEREWVDESHIDAWLRDPWARRTLLEVYEALSGRSATSLLCVSELEADRLIKRRILEALERGELAALRTRDVGWSVLDDEEQQPPRPAPTVEPEASDDFVQFMLFDSAGEPLRAAAATFEVKLSGGQKRAGAFQGGFGAIDTLPPGAPTTCRVTFSGIADAEDPLLPTAPPAGSPTLDAARARGPIFGPHELTRREFGLRQEAALQSTNVFQLVRRKATVFEVEHFFVQSAVCLPGAPPSTVLLNRRDDVVHGVQVLRAILAHAQDTAPRFAIVTGHDDRLSKERADSVRALLVGDRDTWMRIAIAHGAIADYQHILRWVHESPEFSWPCDPGDISNTDDAPTRQALARFRAHYNASLRAGYFPETKTGPVTETNMGAQTWGAMFDCFIRGIRPIADFQPGSLAYIVVDDKHQTYPVELAQLAAPKHDAARWTDLNDPNPEMRNPSGGWLPPQVGQKIYIPDTWDLEALRTAGYEVHPKSAGSSAGFDGPPLLSAPGPEVVGCGTDHVTSPSADAPRRRAQRRHAEVAFIHDQRESPLVAAPPDRCNTRTCELYDPYAFDLRYAEIPRVLRRTVRIWLQDQTRQRMPGAPYRLRVGVQVRTGRANSDGLLEEKNLPVERHCILEWGALPPELEKPRETSFRFSRRLFTDVEDEATARQLHNLAFTGSSFQDQLNAFRKAYPGGAAAEDHLAQVHANGTPARAG